MLLDRAPPGERRRLIAAFAAIYLLWGSTFYAIRVAVREMPPLFTAGTRFALAGLVLYAWSRRTARDAITRPQWRNLLLVGALLFLPTYSALFWAEKTIPSGVAAVLLATLPVWTVILEALVFRIARFGPVVIAPVAMGIAGVALLVGGQGGAGAVNAAGCAAILGSQLTWALGSVMSKRMSLPRSEAARAGVQMTFGGILLLACSLAAGELSTWPQASAVAWGAWAWLVVVAVLGYSAYVWLLERLPATQVSSYTYVNPVVALAIGYALGGEALGVRQLLGAALVIGGVSAVLRIQPASKSSG
jgi:drug/metabolite transporter (DMT)-like permease